MTTNYVTSGNTLFRGSKLTKFSRQGGGGRASSSRGGGLLMNYVRKYWRVSIGLFVILLGFIGYEAFFMLEWGKRGSSRVAEVMIGSAVDASAKPAAAAAQAPRTSAPAAVVMPSLPGLGLVVSDFTASPSSPPYYKYYSWGLAGGMDGRGRAQPVPDNHVPVQGLSGAAVVAASASQTVLALTPSGVVLSFGRNGSSGGFQAGSSPIPDSGQLGRGGEPKAPLPVTWGAMAGRRAVAVCSGRFHSAAATLDGLLVTWGLNDHGQLGRAGVDKESGAPCFCGAGCRDGVPRTANIPGRVLSVSCGRYHVHAIVEGGGVYTVGRDMCGGRGGQTDLFKNTCSLYKHRRIEALPESVVKVSSGYTHWAALGSSGAIYTCATGDDGYGGYYGDKFKPNGVGELGRLGSASASLAALTTPGKVQLPGLARDVASARASSFAVLDKGAVYSWGAPGQVCRKGGPQPAVVAGLDGLPVHTVAAGEYFAVAASPQSLHTCGNQGYWTLGVERKENAPDNFLTVASGAALKIHRVFAGYQIGIALACVGADCDAAGPVPTALPVVAAAPGTPIESVQPTVPLPRAALPPATKAAAASGAMAATATRPSTAGGIKILPAVAARTAAVRTTNATRPPLTREEALSYLSGIHAPVKSATEVWNEFYKANRNTPRHQQIVERIGVDIWEVLDNVTFDARYRNPCFRYNGNPGGPLKCLPGFHIIGVSKCGTTDLYHRLSMYAEFFDSRNKGPHYWDECDYPPRVPCTVGGKGEFARYVELYEPAATKIEKGHPGAFTGDASSNTYTAEGVWIRGHSRRGGDITISELLRYAQPYVRNVIIFRDPVTRHLSAYHYYQPGLAKKGLLTAEHYHKTVTTEIERWKACLAQFRAKAEGRGEEWVEKECVARFEPQQLVKGMYVSFLDGWLKNWPRESLLILRNEDYAVYAKEHIAATIRFIGARDPTEAEWVKILARERTNVFGAKTGVKGGKEVWPETTALLTEFYRPYNERLAKALGGDVRWLWHEYTS